MEKLSITLHLSIQHFEQVRHGITLYLSIQHFDQVKDCTSTNSVSVRAWGGHAKNVKGSFDNSGILKLRNLGFQESENL